MFTLRNNANADIVVAYVVCYDCPLIDFFVAMIWTKGKVGAVFLMCESVSGPLHICKKTNEYQDLRYLLARNVSHENTWFSALRCYAKASFVRLRPILVLQRPEFRFRLSVERWTRPEGNENALEFTVLELPERTLKAFAKLLLISPLAEKAAEGGEV